MVPVTVASANFVMPSSIHTVTVATVMSMPAASAILTGFLSLYVLLSMMVALSFIVTILFLVHFLLLAISL
jgi:hypothetical protein